METRKRKKLKRKLKAKKWAKRESNCLKNVH